MHDRVTQELTLDDGHAELRLDLPFATKGDVSLKKIGLELVVRVGDSKRVIELPSAMASFRPASASFADGALVVTFEPAVTEAVAGA
jgi:arsenite-transporting ATPase